MMEIKKEEIWWIWKNENNRWKEWMNGNVAWKLKSDASVVM